MMKTLSNISTGAFLFAIAGVAFAFPSCNDTPDDPVRVMSYNIRYDNPNDGVNRWDNRKDRIVRVIKFYEPDIIGTQEGLLHQLEYLDSLLTDYSRVGVGRNDGNEEGEFTAIFYNTGRLELVEDSDSTIWLSETPAVPGSKSWDASLPRIVTMAVFNDKISRKQFNVYNTHYDHIGDTARAKSSELILDFIERSTSEKPVILTGDFNATEDTRPYQLLTAENSRLRDAFYASELEHLGPEFTFEGFGVMEGSNRRRIDYIFVNEQVTVQKHAILSTFQNGYYPSDHLPVIVDIDI